VSLFLALVGIALLIVLHELGHFTVAKAVGMRVERACLFFPPLLFKVRRGETEYGIGSIPLGGYVKITGMNPDEIEGLPPEVAARAYYNQAVWKRVAVILAGPVVNLVIAFAIFWVLLLSGSTGADITLNNIAPSVTTVVPAPVVAAIDKGAPAYGVLKLGDKVLAVNGRGGSVDQITKLIGADSCAGAPTAGCAGRAPLALTVLRAGHRVTLTVRPRYSTTAGRMLVGFGFGESAKAFGPIGAAGTAVAAMWNITEHTVTNIGRAFTSSKVRHQLSGIVGVTQVTQEAVASGAQYAFVILGFISLSLAVLNLLPFLPLDGGHILWSVGEKLRRRRISSVAMIRFSAVPVVLLGFLVITALSNNISSLAGSGVH
jgi:regulator of sigma E protease